MTAPIAIKTLVTKAFFGLLLLVPFASQAQNVQEITAVDTLQVGDTFNYAITLDRNQEYDRIIFPDTSSFGSDFEIKSRQQFKTSSYRDSVAYKLQFFGTADTTIPKLPVLLVQDSDTTRLYTNPVPVHFKSVLAGEKNKFRPLKPIYAFALIWWPYLLGAILLAILCYFGYYYYINQEAEEKGPAPEFKPAPFVNPLKEFQKAVRKLEKMEPETKEEFKEFYIQLGDAIRVYFENLYNVPAMESTSRELLNMLNAGAIDQDLIKATKAVLQEADMVKFANFTPSTQQAQRALDKTYDFIKRAKKVDGPRIEHIRRMHLEQVEANRNEFQNNQTRAEVTE